MDNPMKIRLSFNKKDCYIPPCTMEINVPTYRDSEEYIDEYLYNILGTVYLHCIWEYI